MDNKKDIYNLWVQYTTKVSFGQVGKVFGLAANCVQLPLAAGT